MSTILVAGAGPGAVGGGEIDSEGGYALALASPQIAAMLMAVSSDLAIFTEGILQMDDPHLKGKAILTKAILTWAAPIATVGSLGFQAVDFLIKPTDNPCDRGTAAYCRPANDGPHQHHVPWPLFGAKLTATSTATSSST